MSDCDLDDDFDFDDDFGDDSEDSDREYDPNREYPRETDTNFICVSASSLIAEKLLKCGYNNKGVLCFLVRWKGFDEQLDDWVPSSDLPARLVDEFYCAKLNMEPPSLDFDEDYHSDLDEDGDYIPYVPLTQRQIKRQLREAGCFGKTRKPVTTLPKMVIQKLMGLVPSKELSLESVKWSNIVNGLFVWVFSTLVYKTISLHDPGSPLLVLPTLLYHLLICVLLSTFSQI